MTSPPDEEREPRAEDERDSDVEVRPRGGVVLGLIKTIRPHQWVKNLFVLAPIFFAKNVFQTPLLLRALGAVAAFCLLSGAVYTLNDLVDVEADRVHPKKRFRPIASGQVPVPVARAFLGVLVVAVFGASFLLLSRGFVLTAAAYFALNIAYSLKLKKIAFIDVSCISAGFVLRVLGGGFAIDVKVSWYMFACTALLALFLGFGKRRHEIASEKAGKQRKALESYTARGLDVALFLTGGLTLVTYVAYTLDASTKAFFRSDQLWMTAPSVVIGIARFLQIVRGRPKAESPTQEMLRDSMFVLNLVAWAVVVVAIVYRIRPT